MRTTFVLVLLAASGWVGCGNSPIPPSSGSSADSGGKAPEADTDAGEKGAPSMPCEMTGGCADICSGGCVFNAAKMRTECTGAQSKCSGTCGTGCDLQCGGASACNVTVAAGGSFDCKGATCNVTVSDASGSVECSGAGTTCNITCQGDCSFECAKGATCNVRCGGAAAMTTTTSGGCGKGGGDNGGKGGDEAADAGGRGP